MNSKLIVLLSLFYFSISAQITEKEISIFPSYEKVVVHFFSNHTFNKYFSDYYFSFEKKPEVWFVSSASKTNSESVIRTPVWDLKTKTFSVLDGSVGNSISVLQQYINQAIPHYKNHQNQNSAFIFKNISIKDYLGLEEVKFVMLFESIRNKRMSKIYWQGIQPSDELLNCDSNAALFTNTEMDTYPLWHQQQQQGYRDDVMVINLPLLQKAWYRSFLAQEFDGANNQDQIHKKTMQSGLIDAFLKSGVNNKAKAVITALESKVDLLKIPAHFNSFYLISLYIKLGEQERAKNFTTHTIEDYLRQDNEGGYAVKLQIKNQVSSIKSILNYDSSFLMQELNRTFYFL